MRELRYVHQKAAEYLVEEAGTDGDILEFVPCLHKQPVFKLGSHGAASVK
jgi:hypothetical protein